MAKIISLSEASIIGFHSMVLIARSENGLNVQKISEETGSSKHHIVKVLQRLAKNDYLSSVRGPSGGFTLAKDPADITMLEIYECIEGKIEVNKCPMNHAICAFDRCLLNNIPQTMTLQIKDYLEGKTLDFYV